jgi:hypothetical protein
MLGAGSCAAVLALVAWLADRARTRRVELDRVGLVPWTGVFFWATMVAVLLLGAGVRGLL